MGRFVPKAEEAPGFDESSILDAVERPDRPVWVVGRGTHDGLELGVAWHGTLDAAPPPAVAPHVVAPHATLAAYAHLPALWAERLGDRGFCEEHGCRFPYVAGAMATGIASVELTIAAVRAGFLAFFGAAGLSLEAVDDALTAIAGRLGPAAADGWGCNLIHSPDEPGLEEALVDLLLRRDVPRIEASAFLGASASVVRFGATGLGVDRQGRILRPHRVMVKVSRPEVARHFLQPPPATLLRELVARGALSEHEAALAARIPVADDVTCEGDSGGHTDQRPLGVLLPIIRRLALDLAPREGWPRPVRVGAAGGLGDPESIAAAFGMGADYVVTGSVNQAAVESGTSAAVRAMLAEATFTDVTLAPAADMFEIGASVQVLQRGTFYPLRARRLAELYRRYDHWEALPREERERVEHEILRATFDAVWARCEAYWRQRNPAQLDRARTDARHRMALVFRWYLGESSRWAREGDAERRQDYQVWCGPAMGAFNRWTEGSPLAAPEARTVAVIGRSLLDGAVRCTRAAQLRSLGVPVPMTAFRPGPRSRESWV